MKAVITENLSKTYIGGTKAVNNLNLSIEEGEIFGFLGPNGAGKTTTVKLLCGMLAPSDGKSRVLDIDPSENPEKLHSLSGIVTEHAQMYDHLTGLENLIFYGSIFGINKTDSKKKAKSLLEKLNLSEAQNNKLSTYSTGMRQKLSLARAMMHSPKIMFLDEPTSGLDPESAQNVNMLIKQLSENGTTVFLCTHQLRYAQEICTCYGLMSKGVLLADGDIDTLRNMVSTKIRVTVKTSKIPDNSEFIKLEDSSYNIFVDSEDEIPVLVRKITNAGGNLYHISTEKPSLEDIYFSLIKERAEK